MVNNINQQVIDFTAVYTNRPAGDIKDSTTLASIGIISKDDTAEYMYELEDNFGLIYEPGDENGIDTVGNAVVFITNKLGGGGSVPR